MMQKPIQNTSEDLNRIATVRMPLGGFDLHAHCALHNKNGVVLTQCQTGEADIGAHPLADQSRE